MLIISLLAGCFVFAAAAEDFCADFTSLAEGDSLPESLTVLSGSAAAGNGFVELAPGSIVRINAPDAADFTMEVDFTIAGANEDTRWVSFMYRVTGNGADPKPYMQMCVRRGAAAANGVEIACKDAAGSWQYNGKQAYTQNIDASVKYTAKIICSGKNISQSINGTQAVSTDSALIEKEGGFALQSNGSVLRVYAVRIGAPQEIQVKPETSDTVRSVYEPETGLIAPPSVVEKIDSPEKLAALSQDKPAQAAWFSVSSIRGNAVIAAGGSYSFKDAFDACRGRVIPVFELTTSETADALVKYAEENGETDFLAVSNNPEALSRISLKGVHKGLITDAKGAECARAVHSAGADIAVVSSATRQEAEYLQKRFISVMLRPEASTDAAVRAALDNGANHVVVSDHAKAYSLYSSVDASDIFVRRPFIVAHRGVPSLAPENTVEGLLEAVAAGADAVECDVYVTADDQIVINHNGTLGGYTTENVNTQIERLTREELKGYTLKKTGKYDNAKFAFLDEFFDAMKNNDIVLVIEIKTSKRKCADLIREIAESKGMMDRIVIISFNALQVKRVRQVMPEVGASLLTNGSNQSALMSVETVYEETAGFNGAYSPGSSFSAAGVAALRHRGVAVNLWTVDGADRMLEQACKGAAFITTNTSMYRNSIDERTGKLESDSILSNASSPVTREPVTGPQATDASDADTVRLPFGLHIVLIPIAAVVIGASVLIAVFYRKRK